MNQVLGDLKEGDGDSIPGFFRPGDFRLSSRARLALRIVRSFFHQRGSQLPRPHLSTAAYVTISEKRQSPPPTPAKREGVDGEEIDEPLNGFLWTLAKKKGISFRDYGEMVKVPEGWPVTQREVVPYLSPLTRV